MSKENNGKVLSEQLLRDKSRQQMADLHKIMNKVGGDIGEQVRKSENTKEDKMPNAFYMDNPFGQSSRRIETYEDFSSTAKKQFEGKTTCKKFYDWVEGSKEDFERPMFANLPDPEDMKNVQEREKAENELKTRTENKEDK